MKAAEAEVAVADKARAEPSSTSAFWRSRWLLVSVIVVVVLAVVGAGVSVLVYQHTYQPLRPGNFASTAGPHARALTDGIHDTQIIVIGAAGTQARLMYSLSNSGSHAVHLLGLAPDSGIDRIAWGPDVDHNQLLGGTAAESQPFPMTLRAGTTISLWVYVTQPNCSGGGIGTLIGIPMQWSAFGDFHVYSLPLDGNDFLPISVCPPHKALKYIDRF